MEITTIQVKPETRRLVQLRKAEKNFKSYDEVILDALNLSGPKAIKKEGVKKK